MQNSTPRKTRSGKRTNKRVKVTKCLQVEKEKYAENLNKKIITNIIYVRSRAKGRFLWTVKIGSKIYAV